MTRCWGLYIALFCSLALGAVRMTNAMPGYGYFYFCNRVHVVTLGDTCQSIVEEYELSNLVRFFFKNYHLDCDNLRAGQLVCAEDGDSIDFY